MTGPRTSLSRQENNHNHNIYNVAPAPYFAHIPYRNGVRHVILAPRGVRSQDGTDRTAVGGRRKEAAPNLGNQMRWSRISRWIRTHKGSPALGLRDAEASFASLGPPDCLRFISFFIPYRSTRCFKAAMDETRSSFSFFLYQVVYALMVWAFFDEIAL